MFRRLAVRVPRIVPAQVRFASAAAVDAKPPVQLFGLEGTYATALYSAAIKEKSLEQTGTAIERLGKLLTSDSQTAAILSDPTLSIEDKRLAVQVVVENTGNNKLVKGLLDALAGNARLSILPETIKNFGILLNAHRGLVEATVTSVKALDSPTLKRLEKTLAASKYVGQGKTLKLENIVDPSIKGGLIVNIGDRTADFSVATKLNRYNALLTQSI